MPGTRPLLFALSLSALSVAATAQAAEIRSVTIKQTGSVYTVSAKIGDDPDDQVDIVSVEIEDVSRSAPTPTDTTVTLSPKNNNSSAVKQFEVGGLGFDSDPQGSVYALIAEMKAADGTTIGAPLYSLVSVQGAASLAGLGDLAGLVDLCPTDPDPVGSAVVLLQAQAEDNVLLAAGEIGAKPIDGTVVHTSNGRSFLSVGQIAGSADTTSFVIHPDGYDSMTFGGVTYDLPAGSVIRADALVVGGQFEASVTLYTPDGGKTVATTHSTPSKGVAAAELLPVKVTSSGDGPSTVEIAAKYGDIIIGGPSWDLGGGRIDFND